MLGNKLGAKQIPGIVFFKNEDDDENTVGLESPRLENFGGRGP